MFYKIFQACDYLSEKPELYINATSRFKTIYGACLSIMLTCFIISTVLYFCYELFSYNNKLITYQQTPSFDQTLLFSEVPRMMLVHDEFYKPIENDEKYFKINANFITVSGGNITTVSKELTHCDPDYNFGINSYNNLFHEVNYMSSHYCIMKDDAFTYSGVLGQNSTYVELAISKCQNTTISGHCVDLESINKKLGTTMISFKLLTHAVDHDSLIEPFYKHIKNIEFTLSSTVYERNWIYLKNVIYDSDSGFLLKENRRHEFHQFSYISNSVDLRASLDGNLSQIFISLDSFYDRYIREYRKADQTLANIGGVVNAVYILALILSHLLSKELYFVELIQTVFFEFSANYEEKNKRFKNMKLKYDQSQSKGDFESLKRLRSYPSSQKYFV
jgi:hypothetical protein